METAVGGARIESATWKNIIESVFGALGCKAPNQTGSRGGCMGTVMDPLIGGIMSIGLMVYIGQSGVDVISILPQNVARNLSPSVNLHPKLR